MKNFNLWQLIIKTVHESLYPKVFSKKNTNLSAVRGTIGSRKLSETLMAAATWAAAFFTLGILTFLVGFILVKGIPHIKPSLFSLSYSSDNVSLMPALISTIMMTVMSLAIAVPFGIFSAIYLVEYARRGNRVVNLVRMTTETLAGIPSIVYGLFGLLFFVTFLGWGFSLTAGAFTLALMILPLVMRSSEEALKAVPDAFREGSFGLGAGKLRTVFRIVLPSAMPGILAGIILAIGRIVGETAALIYTAGTVAQIPMNPGQSARTLSVHMYALSGEGLYMNEAYATAVVLLLAVVLINTVSAVVAKRIGGVRGKV
jgi:phosphate transport system permease protein